MHYVSQFHIYALLYSVLLFLTSLCVIVCGSICISAKGWVIVHCVCVYIYLYTYRCLYTTSLFIPLLMGVWVASMSWYLKECCCEHSGSVQFSLVTPSCPTLCGPMDRSMPGLPVCHQLLKLAQSPVHWVDDGIQPISSSVIPFSSCPQSFLASGSFPMSWLFASGV